MQGGATPVFIASQNGHLEVTLCLLSDAGADKYIAMQDGGAPLFIAPHQGRQEVVCLLSESGNDRNIAMQGGATPVFIASQGGHLEVACLLAYGQFSIFHVCFCGLGSGNLNFETIPANSQHICF